MHPFFRIWTLGIQAHKNESEIIKLQGTHNELITDINKNMIRLKALGHSMGNDLRNKITTTIHIPNSRYRELRHESEISGVKELKTIVLDHRITTNLINDNRNKVQEISKKPDHIDHEFAILAMLFKKCINASRILKQVEMHRGVIIRQAILAIRHDNKLEYY